MYQVHHSHDFLFQVGEGGGVVTFTIFGKSVSLPISRRLGMHFTSKIDDHFPFYNPWLLRI
jgi:hypothetical protein